MELPAIRDPSFTPLSKSNDMSIARSGLIALLGVFLAGPLAAQTTQPAPAPAPAAAPAQTPAPTPLNFSGVIFGSYNYQLPTTPSQLRNQTNNSFVVDRAYLTFRMPAGDRTSIRITTDVFQSTDSTSNAYTVRAKYAYLQYDVPKFANGAAVTGRIGILQNVIIDQIENFWPRYLSQAPVERAGYFASADVGVAGLLALPNKMGEVYGTSRFGSRSRHWPMKQQAHCCRISP
jgi:hypothetical protein